VSPCPRATFLRTELCSSDLCGCRPAGESWLVWSPGFRLPGRPSGGCAILAGSGMRCQRSARIPAWCPSCWRALTTRPDVPGTRTSSATRLISVGSANSTPRACWLICGTANSRKRTNTLDFPGTVYGTARGTSATERMSRQTAWYASHLSDRQLPEKTTSSASARELKVPHPTATVRCRHRFAPRSSDSSTSARQMARLSLSAGPSCQRMSAPRRSPLSAICAVQVVAGL
jgi:hypothetical protein